MGGASSNHLFLILFFIVLTTFGHAHNITEILSGFPDYSLMNSYLSQTKLNDEINSRQSITVLVLNNGAMSALAAKHPLSVIKKALSLLILLDYYDGLKLHQISEGTTLSTTLYQTTGNAIGNLGFINITDLKGGKVGFGSAAPGSKLDSSYSKSVKQIPYNISVLEINAPIIAPGILSAPSPSASDANITGLLKKAGCKTFASLILSSGVLKIYQSEMEKGLTVFAPSDEAFKAPGIPDISKLSSAEVVTLLQYHAVAGYKPIGTLKTTTEKFDTLATNGAGKYKLGVSTAGDSVTLNTGLDSSRVSSTLLDNTPVVIFTVESILLQKELFGFAPAPSPGPSPVSSPAPSPYFSSPVPSPASATTPSPVMDSPPAPPMGTPSDSPGMAPDSDSAADSTADSGAVNMRSPALLKTVITISAAILVWVL